jgi:hypothetical protein
VDEKERRVCNEQEKMGDKAGMRNLLLFLCSKGTKDKKQKKEKRSKGSKQCKEENKEPAKGNALCEMVSAPPFFPFLDDLQATVRKRSFRSVRHHITQVFSVIDIIKAIFHYLYCLF